MAKIIINATAAKSGGALTILRTFLESIPHNRRKDFLLLAPQSYEIDQLKSIRLSTCGIFTYIFSVIGIGFYQLVFSSRKVLSFNNVNTIFYSSSSMTYFHQLKMFDRSYKDLKLSLYRFTIRYINSRSLFIVQTKTVRDLFIKFDTRIGDRALIVWPGFIKEKLEENTFKLPNYPIDFDIEEFGLIPIAYDTDHKNLSFLSKINHFFHQKNIKNIILTKNASSLTNLESIFEIGQVSREQLYYLYSKAKFLIFTSLSETVGLPIFEFLETGKPTFVFGAQYAVDFYYKFHQPSNLILFNTEDEFKELFLQNIDKVYTSKSYSDGEWIKILEKL
ncbi:hypothetical protein [Dokdonia sp. LLG6352-1]|uniref:hypothetical protein n=1 Tax=Dokdonia sp. LLG6352-1 TaxID=3160831 RepID=UPI0038701A1F